MRQVTFGFLTVVLLTGVSSTGLAQGLVEYGLGAGRAATSTAPARGLATGIGGVFENLSKTVEAGQRETGSEPETSPNPPARRSAAPKGRHAQATRQTARVEEKKPVVADTPPPPPPQVYEDPKQIQTGMAYDEVIRRFGPPSMSATTGPGAGTLWYRSYQIEMEAGKVVTAPSAKSE
jgi:hypothetical protein